MSKNIFETLVLGANEEHHTYNCNAWSFLLLTNDQSTDVQIGIEDDDLADWPEWRKYHEATPEGRFSKVVFTNPTGNVMTLTFVVSEGEIDIATEYGSLTNIYNQLVTIDSVLDNVLDANTVPDTITQIDDTTPAQTGSTGTQLVAAGSGKRKVFIQFDYDDSSDGRVYIGLSDAVSSTSKIVMLVPGDGHLFEVNDDLYAVSKNGTESVWGYVLSKS